MARIIGVELPKNKRIVVALTYLYGVGNQTAKKVLASTNIDTEKKAKDLTDDEVAKLTSVFQTDLKVEGDLKREVASHIKRLVDIGSYRGIRHKRGLPVRGQQTRTNARGRKGPRPRVGGRKRTGDSASSPKPSRK